MINMMTNNKKGWSLILLLFVIGSFIAVFPLVATHIDKNSTSTLAHERWSQWNRAREANANRLAKANINDENHASLPGTNFSTSTRVEAILPGDIRTLNATDTPFTGFKSSAWQVKPGTAEPDFDGGTGTEDDPFLIATPIQLHNVRKYLQVEDSHFQIVADIDLEQSQWSETESDKGWEPIGTEDTPFTGTISAYDSDADTTYAISGLWIKDENKRYRGLFGYIESASISDIILTDVNINISGSDADTQHTGALAGRAVDSQITNVTADGQILAHDFVGGIIGSGAGTTTIENSHSQVEVTGTGVYVGGLAGFFNADEIRLSSASSNVTGLGDVRHSIGGFVGNLAWGSNIFESFATGNVSAEGTRIGGLVGNFHGGGEISNSYSTGDVTSTNNSAEIALGGLVGRLEQNSATVNNSFSTGSLISEAGTGGKGPLIGLNKNGTDNVTNSYFDVFESDPDLFIASGTALTNASMTAKATFPDTEWDFSKVWQINENNSYPYLRNNTQEPAPEPVSLTASQEQGDQSQIIRDVNNYRIYALHQYTTVGNSQFKAPTNIKVDYLIVGGGGGGAGNTQFSSAGGGGGGAGGLIFKQNEPIASGSQTNVEVGDGGAGIDQQGTPADNGEDSSAFGLIALGGGGGILTSGTDNTPASDGGSGGGGRQNPAGEALQPTSASGGFGNDGGRNESDDGGAGGGGAGSAAPNITSNAGGNGGYGRYYGNIFGDGLGDNGWFAGGGGGGGDADDGEWGLGGERGLGGIGGGGNGSSAQYTIAPTDGMQNTGGGGGGGSSSHPGANGGSGIVLIRYPYDMLD